MRLSPLLAAVPSELSPQTFPADIAPNDTVIRGIGYDSRTVAPGDLFVALRGADQDGHDYLAEALRAGASALLVEDRSRLPADIGVPVIVVARYACPWEDSTDGEGPHATNVRRFRLSVEHGTPRA